MDSSINMLQIEDFFSWSFRVLSRSLLLYIRIHNECVSILEMKWMLLNETLEWLLTYVHIKDIIIGHVLKVIHRDLRVRYMSCVFIALFFFSFYQVHNPQLHFHMDPSLDDHSLLTRETRHRSSAI